MVGWVPQDRVEPVAIAVKKVLADGDVQDLSLRNIATYVGCTASTLSHRFGTRAALLAHVAQWLGEQWTDAVFRETMLEQVTDILGTWERTGEQARPWLTMCEVGRGDPLTGGVVAQAERDERRYLERVLPDEADQAERDLLVSLVRGLRHELRAGTDPMPIERGRAVLTLLDDLLRRRQAA